MAGNTAGGWNIQPVIYALWEPLVAWGIISGLLQFFEHGVLWPHATLARRAHAIVVIHPPILVAVALSWRGVPADHLLKFAITGVVSCLLCYACADCCCVCERSPGCCKVEMGAG